MKKALIFLFVAGAMTACNNSATPEQRIKDSLDSIGQLKKESVEQAADQAKDTIEAHTDSLKQLVDSVGKVTRDSLQK